MKTPWSHRITSTLVKLYRLALWLYPASFLNEYAEEMQVVFRLRLEDAVRSGRGALLHLVFNEALTLPSGAIEAYAQSRKSPNFITFILDLFNFQRERGLIMSIRQLFPESAEQTPWVIAILSLVPFILPGPLAPLLNYHPWWDPNELPLIAAARVPLTAVLLLLGFLFGILRGFPRWTYLYCVYILFLLNLGINELILRDLFHFTPDVEGTSFMLLVLLLVVVIVIFKRKLHFLQSFFTNIRRDWTLLSYALYACTFFLTATNDFDESPVYNLQVLLPSLITWLGALAYLRMPDPLKKVAALLGAIFLGELIWWWPVIAGNSSSLPGLLIVSGMLLIIWLILGGLVLAPGLVHAVIRRRSETIR